MKKLFMLLFSVISVFSFSANENLVRKISVTGNAEREIMPDMATLNFSIISKKENLNDASNDVNKRFEKFKSVLKSKNIKIGEIETVSLSNQKVKEYENNNIYDENGKIDESKKTPSSYDAKLGIVLNNIEFDKIAELIGNDENNLQSIQKNFNDNTFALQVKENGKTPELALNKAFDKINSTKNELQKLGISENNILIGEYDIKEQFDKDENSKQKEYYYVRHYLKLTTKNLKELNTIISLANDNEINIEGSINFDLSNKETIESEMYNEAYTQAKQKATSILKSSTMTLGTPIIVSEDIDFQEKMINRIDSDWRVEAMAEEESRVMRTVAVETTVAYASAPARQSKMRATIDYTPKPLKLEQNISVMYEMK